MRSSKAAIEKTSNMLDHILTAARSLFSSASASPWVLKRDRCWASHKSQTSIDFHVVLLIAPKNNRLYLCSAQFLLA